jgi:hypothetical protein
VSVHDSNIITTATEMRLQTSQPAPYRSARHGANVEYTKATLLVALIMACHFHCHMCCDLQAIAHKRLPVL